MALFEDLFEGVAGPAAIGIGALFLVPTALPAVGRLLRPIAKELIKTGMMAYDEAHLAVSGAYEEARAEWDSERENRSPRGETLHRTAHRHKTSIEPRERGDELGQAAH